LDLFVYCERFAVVFICSVFKITFDCYHIRQFNIVRQTVELNKSDHNWNKCKKSLLALAFLKKNHLFHRCQKNENNCCYIRTLFSLFFHESSELNVPELFFLDILKSVQVVANRGKKFQVGVARPDISFLKK